MNKFLLTKSAYLQGLQCRKLLWFRFNARDQFQPPSTQTQAIFDQGHEVGHWAKKLFPDGFEIAPGARDFERVCSETRRLAELRKPLFEPGFLAKGCFARIDILNPIAEDQWDIIEVKSSTGIKDIYLEDVAFQYFVCKAAGVKIRQCFILHINSEYVRRGDIEPGELFAQVDVTELISVNAEVTDQIRVFSRIVDAANHPEVNIGPHCHFPYECPLVDVCWSFLPEHNVTTLYRGSKKAFKLLEQDITDIAKIPESIELGRIQQIQKLAIVTGQIQCDHNEIKAFLDRLKYPLYYLDFETMAPAIPLFEGTRPYQQIPFQFSLHVVPYARAEPEHFSFLADGRNDPRPAFMEALIGHVGSSGSIITYNAAFERSVLNGCSKFMPEHCEWVQELGLRILDLLIPFRKFYCYHPSQSGSASIKSVLPALTGKNYNHLAIAEVGPQALSLPE